MAERGGSATPVRDRGTGKRMLTNAGSLEFFTTTPWIVA